MEVILKKNGEESADFELPGGCALCGGPLSVRLSHNGAHSVCVPCRWMARPSVELRPGGMNVVFGTNALA
jgi:hypothetical protein